MPRPNDSLLDWLDTLLKSSKGSLVHYQVLGLPMFEEDPQRIRQAVQRQIKALWTYAHGPLAHQVRKGRQLVDQASRHLLNPRLKAAYDAELRKKLAVEVAVPTVVNIQTVDVVGERMSKAEQDSNRTILMASVAAFVCIAAALAIAFIPGLRPRPTIAVKPSDPFAASPVTPPVSVAEKTPSTSVATKTSSTPTAAPANVATKTPSPPASSTVAGSTVAGSTSKEAPAGVVSTPVAPPPPPTGSSSGRLILGDKTIEVFPESVVAANGKTPADADESAKSELKSGPASTGPAKAVELPPVPRMAGLWKSAAGKVRSLAVSPDGRTLVTGGWDKTVRLWDVESGKELRRFAGHADNVYDVAIRADGSQVASCGADGRVLVWNVKGDDDEPRIFEGHQGSVQRVAFLHKSGKLASAGSDQTIRIWHLASGMEEVCMKGNDRWMTLAVSPNDEHVLAGGRDGSLVLWSIASGKPESTFDRHHAALHSVAFLDGGKQVLSAAWDGTVRLWDTETTAELERFEGAGTGQASLVLSPTGERFATGGEDGRITLWDVATRRQLATYDGHRERVARIAFQPGTGAMVSVGWDDEVRYWQTP